MNFWFVKKILIFATKVINYIHVLSNFHSSRQPPDVLRGELWDRGVSNLLIICLFNFSVAILFCNSPRWSAACTVSKRVPILGTGSL